MLRITVVIVLSSVLIASCSSDPTPRSVDPGPIAPDRALPPTTLTVAESVSPLIGLTLEPVAEGLERPTAIAPAPGLGETFIAEQSGRLVTVSSGGTETVLNVSARISYDENEQGFLGFAVHPSFPDDPRGFAVYSNTDGDVVVTSNTWTGTRFDAASEKLILTVDQPHKYHQGGGILFGPRGYLWLSFGDGGGIGDPFRNGQDADTLNGTLARLDVDFAQPYAVPSSNPFIDGGGAPEVWAYGLRNPWTFAIEDEWVIIADVGQGKWDEIDVVALTAQAPNFGWPTMEADECFESDPCSSEGTVLPRISIPTTTTCALIGGPVYRGAMIPELYGHYLFGSYCRGWIHSAPFEAGALGDVVSWAASLGDVGSLTSIGLDHEGEILIATLEGSISRIVPVR